MNIICAITIIVIFQLVNCDGSFPNTIQRCKFGDTNCVTNTINEVIKSSPGGIPEIGLGSIDPLIIGKSTIEQGARSSAVNLKIRMKNTNLFGIKQFTVKKVVGFEKDPNTLKFELYGVCPIVTIEGLYEITGKVLLLPVSGQGTANISLYDNDISMNLTTHIENRKNKEYVVVDDIEYSSKSARMFINMDNLFNDATISKTMNGFFNENQAILYQELAPSMNAIFSNILKKRIQAVFNKFPYKDLFLE